MSIKIEQGESYKITNGNGGLLEAKVVERTTKPPRVVYVTRGIRPGAARGRGTFTRASISVPLPAFRKLLADQPSA